MECGSEFDVSKGQGAVDTTTLKPRLGNLAYVLGVSAGESSKLFSRTFLCPAHCIGEVLVRHAMWGVRCHGVLRLRESH